MRTKNIIEIMVVVSILILSHGCKKQIECRYDNMAYDNQTKKCECVQTNTSASPSSLSSTDYNSCENVKQSFFHFSIDNSDYPYYSHAGDTIKFCGYVKHSYGKPLQYDGDSSYCQFTMIDDYMTAMDASNHNGGAFFIESIVDKMVDVEFSRKCYVIGVLAFGSTSAKIPWVSTAEPGTCHSADLLFNVIDIHN